MYIYIYSARAGRHRRYPFRSHSPKDGRQGQKNALPFPVLQIGSPRLYPYTRSPTGSTRSCSSNE